MLPESFIHQIDKGKTSNNVIFNTYFPTFSTCKTDIIMSTAAGDAVSQPAEKPSYGMRKNGMF